MAVPTTAKLSSGYECPLMGYGTFLANNDDELKTAVKAAVKTGYRHIDTAFVYQNEEAIGAALEELYAEGVVKREDLFITTKLWPIHFRPDLVVDQLKSQLAKLRTTYVDLYLMHFPTAMIPLEGQLIPITPEGKVAVDLSLRIEDTWPKMEECVNLGLTRSIGVSNFNISQVDRILKIAKIKPAMIQCESHPFFSNEKLFQFCKQNGVAFTAYSQFGSPGFKDANGESATKLNLLANPILGEIGKKYGKNQAQVILRWVLQRGIHAIPKSTTPARIADNFNIFDFELSAEDMATIKAMDTDSRVSWFNHPGVKDHPDYPHTSSGSC